MDAKSVILELVNMEPQRLFTLYELERESGLDGTTAEQAAEELVRKGELVRVGDQYRQPAPNEV